MNFDDIKDRLKNDLQLTWQRFQDSSLFNKIKDIYDNLSPLNQKISILITSLIFSFLILSIPYDKYSTSSESVTEFEGTRDLIRELHSVQQELAESPQINPAPSDDEIKNQIESTFKKNQLIPEQNATIEIQPISSSLIKAQNIQSGFVVQIKKLNLRQVLDIGHQIQSFTQALKLKDLTLEANASDTRYFDVVFKLITIKVPEKTMMPLPINDNSPGKRRLKNNNDTDEESLEE